jgi:hypothetical protein
VRLCDHDEVAAAQTINAASKTDFFMVRHHTSAPLVSQERAESNVIFLSVWFMPRIDDGDPCEKVQVPVRRMNKAH